jgi:hypothetical protein
MQQPARYYCVLFALLSFVMIAAWQELVIRYYYQGNQTGLFCTGDRQKIPEPLREGTYLFRDSHGYDGEFYRYLAHDPFFRRGFAGCIDDPRFRAQRILVPLLAWTVSFGQDAFIDRAYQFVVVAFCAMGVYWTCSWLLLAGCPSWWGLPVFLLLPATLASFDRMLLDSALCALFAGFLYYLRQERWRPLYAIVLLAPLVRDTGFLMLAGIVVSAAYHRQWRRAAVFASAVLPAALWMLFVRAHTPPSSVVALGNPVIGVLERVFVFRRHAQTAYPALQGAIDTVSYSASVGYALCFVIAIVWLWSLSSKEAWTPAAVTAKILVLLGLSLGTEGVLVEAYAYGRALSPLLLWIALTALARRAWLALAPPVMVTLAVGMYLASPTYRSLRALLGV